MSFTDRKCKHRQVSEWREEATQQVSDSKSAAVVLALREDRETINLLSSSVSHSCHRVHALNSQVWVSQATQVFDSSVHSQASTKNIDLGCTVYFAEMSLYSLESAHTVCCCILTLR